MKKLISLFGLGYFVSVGYMDPGNWSTDIAAGAEFGYQLLWVLIVSNIIAIVLQTFTIYLGIYSGKDLAEVCKEKYPKPLRMILFILTQIAIIATDLAELLGSAVALNLLFNIPIMYGVIITVLDVFIILLLEGRGFEKLHAIIVVLVLTITACFSIELLYAQPNPVEVSTGLIPHLENMKALFIAIGMIGATIMPHNLYMQSGLVKDVKVDNDKDQVVKKQIIDLIIALFIALIVNGGILILSSAVFHSTGNTSVASIQTAYELLTPLMGVKVASLLFAFALLLSGQASTITGTLSGQIVMNGFLNLKISATKMRLFTRICAIVPALFVIGIYGSAEVDNLLILSQVVLSLQLPFAIIPLIIAVNDHDLMNKFKVNRYLTIFAIISGAVICILNMILVINIVFNLSHSLLFTFIVVVVILYLLILLKTKYIKPNKLNVA